MVAAVASLGGVAERRSSPRLCNSSVNLLYSTLWFSGNPLTASGVGVVLIFFFSCKKDIAYFVMPISRHSPEGRGL